MTVWSNLGSGGDTQQIASTTDANQLSVNDNWVVTDDASSNGGSPAMLHLFAGPGGERPNSVNLNVGQLSYNYTLEVEPGETQIVMHFASQNANRTDAQNNARRLQELPTSALAGMSADELSQVVNFSLGGGTDWHSVNLADGQQVTLQTADAGLLELESALDPRLIILNPDGSERAVSDNSAADGRNAEVTFTAGQPGVYRVGVAPTAGTGEYLLSVNGQVMDSTPEIASTSPPIGALIADELNAIEVSFLDGHRHRNDRSK